MTAIPYIGSRISLISKNEIRYEGILYSIDPKESKVALQNVRSYGTEDRKKEVIPPSNEVYDYIIFRGSEIKDLTVCEAPRQAPMIPDSAILAMPHLAQTQFNAFGGQPNYPNMNIPPNYAQPFGGFNPYYHSFFGFQAMNQSGQPGGQPGQQPGQPGQPGGQQSTPTPTATPQATSQATSQVTPSPAQPKEVKASTPAQTGVSDVKSKTPTSVASPQEGQTSATTVQSSAPTSQAPTTPIAGPVPTAPTLSPPTTTTIPTAPTTTASASIAPTTVPTTQDSETSDSQDQGSRYSGRKSTQRSPGDRRGGAGNVAGSGNQRGRRGGRYTTTNGPRVLEEFDFESMNAKFDKVKVAEEITKSTTKEENETTPEEGAREAVDSAPVETVAPSYNKTKSFFDSISCDALDRISEQNTNDKGKARKTYQEQRKLDEETFGRSGYGNRGNQRGGRGGRRYYSGNQPRENGTGAREGSSNYRGNDRQANKTYNRQ